MSEQNEKEETEEKEEQEPTGEDVGANEYQDTGTKEEPTPEEELEEEEETTARTTTQLAIDMLGADLPGPEKDEFEEDFKKLGGPWAEVAGVEQSYPNMVRKAKNFPWPIRVLLGTVGLMGTGLFIKSRKTGRSFKQELQSTLNLSKSRGSSTSPTKGKTTSWREDVREEKEKKNES